MLPPLLAILPFTLMEPLRIKGLLMLRLWIGCLLTPASELCWTPDARLKELDGDSEGRAFQGLPRPNSHLPPEAPLSEPAVYLHHDAVLSHA